MAEPVRPEQRVGCSGSFARVQAEVSVYQLYRPCRAVAVGYVDLDPDGAARLETETGKGAGADNSKWMRAQYRVAELFVFHGDGGMECEEHLECVGDGAGLIEVPGAGPADVDLL